MRIVLILVLFLSSCSYIGIRDKTEDYKGAKLDTSMVGEST